MFYTSMMNQEKMLLVTATLVVAVVITIVATTGIIVAAAVQAQVQPLQIPPLPPQQQEEEEVDPVLEIDVPENASERIQTIIRPASMALLPNETLSIPTTGTVDIDFKGLPPAGIVVTIDNSSATVTKTDVFPDNDQAAPTAAPVEEIELVPVEEDSDEDEDEDE